jgi:TonB-linked SusC/RagA family outer membrane protein
LIQQTKKLFFMSTFFRFVPTCISIIFFLLTFCVYAAAQSSISGRVISGADEQPVVGATVQVKGTLRQTVTDQGGRFTIGAGGKDILVISSIGFFQKEINAADDLSAVTLLVDSKNLNEVIVTALGIKKEVRKVGYATQNISTADLVKAREPNAVNSLKGKVAGLLVNINSELLRNPSINFRGEGNILFVVDGVPIKTDTWNISPDDIESYSFLKGQTAASLYGSLAKDGAIIINTKKGTKDKRGFSIEFNSSVMFENGFLAFSRVQDEYGPGSNGKYAFKDGVGGGINDNDYDIWGPRFEGQLLPQYDGELTPGQTYTTTFKDGSIFTGNIKPTPWTARGKDNLKRFLRTGLLTNNHIAIASQTDKYDIRLGFGNTYQRAIIPNMDLNIINFNMSAGYNFSPKVRMSANVNYNRQFSENFPDVNYGPNSLIYNMSIWAGSDWNVSDMSNYWQKGKEGIQQIYAEYQRYNNPYFTVYEWLRGHYKNDIYGYLTFNWKFAPGFELMYRPGISTYDLVRTEKMPYSAGSYGRDDRKGDYREDKRVLFESNNELQVRYNQKHFNNFLSLDGMLGGNINTARYDGSWASTDYLIVPGVYNFNNSLRPRNTFNFRAEQLVLSGYYSLDVGLSKYATLSTTGRLEKHSNLAAFGSNYFYYSVGGATSVSDYVQLPKAISFLKLRASYATGRNPQTFATTGPLGPLQGNPLGYGDNYQSPYGLGAYAFSKEYPYNTFFAYNNAPAASYTNSLNDPAIVADLKRTTELGLDIRFFKNRIGLDVTWFQSNSELLTSRQISIASGYNQVTENRGKIQNRGWELIVNGTAVKTRSIQWDVLLNWSTFKRTWLDHPNPSPWNKTGDRVDLVYGAGFIRLPDGNYLHGQDGLLMRFRDGVNGGGAQRIFGNADPDWIWGITNNIRYKNFRLGFQLDGVVGGIIWNQIRRRTVSGGRHAETVEGLYGIHRNNDATGGTFVGPGVTFSGNVKPVLDPITGEILNLKDLTIVPNTTTTTVQQYASRYASGGERELMYQDKTFAKLREVTVTYNLPSSLFKRIKAVNAANISLVGRNLLLFYPKDKRDLDPDQFTQASGSDIQSPSTRRYGFNINITF